MIEESLMKLLKNPWRTSAEPIKETSTRIPEETPEVIPKGISRIILKATSGPIEGITGVFPEEKTP